MPRKPKRPCSYPGCRALVSSGGRCRVHRRKAEAVRGSAHERGYTAAWREAREAWLREHPLCQCEECDEGRKRTTAAAVVDHRIPHRGDQQLFWDRGNWQSMSKSCHDRKTATRDGGFGQGGGQMFAPSKS